MHEITVGGWYVDHISIRNTSKRSRNVNIGGGTGTSRSKTKWSKGGKHREKKSTSELDWAIIYSRIFATFEYTKIVEDYPSIYIGPMWVTSILLGVWLWSFFISRWKTILNDNQFGGHVEWHSTWIWRCLYILLECMKNNVFIMLLVKMKIWWMTNEDECEVEWPI